MWQRPCCHSHRPGCQRDGVTHSRTLRHRTACERERSTSDASAMASRIPALRLRRALPATHRPARRGEAAAPGRPQCRPLGSQRRRPRRVKGLAAGFEATETENKSSTIRFAYPRRRRTRRRTRSRARAESEAHDSEAAGGNCRPRHARGPSRPMEIETRSFQMQLNLSQIAV